MALRLRCPLGFPATARACLALLHCTLWLGLGTDLQVARWVKYPGSQTNATIAGTMYVHEIGNQHRIAWSLTGTDDACPTGSGNVCGIHIHEGKDCSDNTTIGGHYYSSSSLAGDPWASVRYNSTSGASISSSGDLLRLGVATSDLVGRAMVVHNSVGSGERIACGIVEVVPSVIPLIVTSWVPYPNSSTDVVVTGTVTFGLLPSIEPTVAMSWNLIGTDDACPTGSGNVCGIHIHEGTTCESHSAIGGHHYNKLRLSTDPWVDVRYNSTGGISTSTAATPVTTGLAMSSLVGRTVIVHNSQGAGERIACGTLHEQETTTPAPTAQLSAALGLCASSLLMVVIIMIRV